MPGIKFRVQGAQTNWGPPPDMAGAMREGMSQGYDRATREAAGAGREADRQTGLEQDRFDHSWLDEQFGELSDDPIEHEAFGGMSLEMKKFELKRRQDVRDLEEEASSAQYDAETLRMDPRSAEFMAQYDKAMEDPGSADVEGLNREVTKRKKAFEQNMALEFELERSLMAAEQFMASGDPDGMNPAIIIAMQTGQRMLEAQRTNPNLPPLTRTMVENVAYKLSLAKMPSKHLERVVGDAQREAEQEMVAAFRDDIIKGMSPTDPHLQDIAGDAGPARTPADPHSTVGGEGAPHAVGSGDLPPEIAEGLDALRGENGTLKWDSLTKRVKGNYNPRQRAHDYKDDTSLQDAVAQHVSTIDRQERPRAILGLGFEDRDIPKILKAAHKADRKESKKEAKTETKPPAADPDRNIIPEDLRAPDKSKPRAKTAVKSKKVPKSQEKTWEGGTVLVQSGRKWIAVPFVEDDVTSAKAANSQGLKNFPSFDSEAEAEAWMKKHDKG